MDMSFLDVVGERKVLVHFISIVRWEWYRTQPEVFKKTVKSIFESVRSAAATAYIKLQLYHR